MSRPFRYTFILAVVALATALAAVGGWRYARASAPVNGPIILLSVDSLRADRLPAYGNRSIDTPAIDTLAEDGVVFERAYSHSPQTLPAHVAMLTGQLPFETGVRDGVGFLVKAETRLLAEMLRDRGFATGAVVSSYLLRKDTGINQGFTFFDDAMEAGRADSDAGDLHRSGEASEQIAERWLAGEDTSRLFLLLHLDEVDGDAASPVDATSGYTDRVLRADAAVGRLIRYLKTHQLYDRSTIILVSDHGEGLGDHGEQGHGLLLYDEVLRIPLIIKPPAGQGDAGLRVRDVVQHIDLVPTILDLAKAPTSGQLTGESLVPVLEGGKPDKRYVYAESLFARYHLGADTLTSITDGRYRYIRAPREELYDLETDPKQSLNLTTGDPAAIPPAIDVLRRELKKFGAGVEVVEPDAVSDGVRESLAALGYVGTAPEGTGGAPIDPKDRVAFLEQYRTAVRLGVDRHWTRAIDMFRAMVRSEPERSDLWRQLATFAGRSGRVDLELQAFKRVLLLEPDNTAAHLGAASALLRQRRFTDAQEHAQTVLAADVDAPSKVAAHTLLLEIALSLRDADAAREQVVLARQSDSRIPFADYAEARLLFDRGRAADAVPLFEQALALAGRPGAPPLPDLRYYAGEAFMRVERYDAAELEFVEEVKAFPRNLRARAALATLYARQNKLEEAGDALSDLVRISPTPDTYRTAARLWETFGKPREAAAVRAESRRLFGDLAQPTQ